MDFDGWRGEILLDIAVGVFLGPVVGYDLLIGKVIQVVMIASRFCFLNLVTS